MYVIRRTSDGKFVAIPGSKNSYTTSIRKARVFTTRESAENSRCVENEYVENLENLLYMER